MRQKLAGLFFLAMAACTSSSGRDGLPTVIGLIKLIPNALVNQREGLSPDQKASIRRALEADGKPSISVSLPGQLLLFMVPYYPSRTGQVWSSMTYETVTLRDGVLQSTRGLGRDIMATRAPDVAMISSAGGSFHRIYEYLDGADQPMQVDYDCDLAPGGSENVDVLGLVYSTRLVVEDCTSGKNSFQNRYWFDTNGSIRQSVQFFAPGRASLTLQKIVD